MRYDPRVWCVQWKFGSTDDYLCRKARPAWNDPARPTTVTAIHTPQLWARSVQQSDVTYNDIVEVLDGDRLTLGIIVHIPHQYYNSFGPVTIDKLHLHYRFSVLLYKPNGRIVLEDVPPRHLFRTYVIEADSQIAALRAASENICVQE